MNFFSHFCYEYPVSSPYFLYGLMLPDLVVNFNSSFKPFIKKTLPSPLSPEHSIQEGISAHWEADKWFHNSSFFLNNYRCTMEKLDSHQKLSRKYFLAHIAVEMYLDKILIEQNHSKLVEYYQILNEVEKKIVKNYFALTGKINFEERSWQRFRQFKDEKFLTHYTNNEKLMNALSSLYFRVLRKSPDYDFHQMEDVFQELEQNIKKEYLTLFS